jgi:hypothetical protein
MRILHRLPRNLRPIALLVAVCVIILGINSITSGSKKVSKTPTPAPTPIDQRFEDYNGTCTTYGVAYEDPGENAADRVKVFGPPDQTDTYETVDFFGIAVDLHPKVAACLEAVQRDLIHQETTYKVNEVGGYREEKADRPYFFHQYGGALDINPATNPQCLGDLSQDAREGVDARGRCDLAKPYDLPQEWIDTFARYGFYWGGNFSEGKDYMHFEWHGEKP